MFSKEFSVQTSLHQEIIDITVLVKKAVNESKVHSGLCNIFIPHATAAVIINENADPSIRRDIIKSLSGLVPAGVWEHDRIDDNASAHIKSSIFSPSITLPIIESELVLGTWQGIGLVEFDGPRERKVIMSVISGK